MEEVLYKVYTEAGDCKVCGLVRQLPHSKGCEFGLMQERAFAERTRADALERAALEVVATAGRLKAESYPPLYRLVFADGRVCVDDLTRPYRFSSTEEAEAFSAARFGGRGKVQPVSEAALWWLSRGVDVL